MTSPDPTQTPALLESMAQMGTALAAQQELSTRLERFLQILTASTAAARTGIIQADRAAGDFKLLAGSGISSEDLQTGMPVQESVRAALQGEGRDSRDSAVVIPLGAPGIPAAAIYLEAAKPDTLPLARAAAGTLALALQAEQSRLERQKFTSVVTHELRIPMTSIKGYTDLLRQGLVGPVNDDQQNFLNIIRSNVDRMSALVSDISDLNRMESGRLRINPATLDVKRCIQEAVDGLRSAIEEKGQWVRIEIDSSLPAVRGDHSRVVQILGMLLNNAHLYSPANTEIRLSAKGDASAVVFAVQDHGAGISSQDQPQIFEPFFRSEDTAIREHPGWGLSLSVARGLLQMMQGRIAFESQPGQGSVFWFSLPLNSESEA